MRSLPFSAAALALSLCAPSCSSVDWIEPEAGLPQEWRDLRLHPTGDYLVLASSEAAARDVIEQAEDARSEFTEVAELPPGRLLLIAMDEEDPALYPASAHLEASIGAWHALATEREPPPVPAREPSSDRGENLDPAALSRLIAFALPRDDESLGLPAALRGSVVGILVLPTERCVEATVDALMDLAGEEMKRDEDIGLAERAMIAAAMPFARSMMRSEFLRMNQGRMFDLFATLAERDLGKRSKLLLDAYLAAGLDAADAEPW